MKGVEVANELCGPQESGVSLLLPSSIDKAFDEINTMQEMPGTFTL